MATTADTSFRYVAETARMLAGLLIWAAHFSVVYTVTALACARHFEDVTVLGLGIVPLVVVLATLLAVAAAGLVLALALRDLQKLRRTPEGNDSRRFLSYTTATVAGLSLLAIVWDGLPALIVPVCG